MVPSKYRQHSTWPPCCERLWRPPHRWPFLSELRALDTFANQHLSTDKTKSHWEILFQAHGMNSMQFQQQVVLYFLSGNLEGTSAKQIQTFLSWAVIRLTFASPWTWWKKTFHISTHSQRLSLAQAVVKLMGHVPSYTWHSIFSVPSNVGKVASPCTLLLMKAWKSFLSRWLW